MSCELQTEKLPLTRSTPGGVGGFSLLRECNLEVLPSEGICKGMGEVRLLSVLASEREVEGKHFIFLLIERERESALSLWGLRERERQQSLPLSLSVMIGRQ